MFDETDSQEELEHHRMCSRKSYHNEEVINQEDSSSKQNQWDEEGEDIFYTDTDGNVYD